MDKHNRSLLRRYEEHLGYIANPATPQDPRQMSPLADLSLPNLRLTRRLGRTGAWIGGALALAAAAALYVAGQSDVERGELTPKGASGAFVSIVTGDGRRPLEPGAKLGRGDAFLVSLRSPVDGFAWLGFFDREGVLISGDDGVARSETAVAAGQAQPVGGTYQVDETDHGEEGRVVVCPTRQPLDAVLRLLEEAGRRERPDGLTGIGTDCRAQRLPLR